VTTITDLQYWRWRKYRLQITDYCLNSKPAKQKQQYSTTAKQ